MNRPSVDISEVVENQEPGWFAAGIFLLASLVMFADGFDNQAINYAAPSIIAEWRINRALMTPVFNLSIAGAITGAVVFAMLADSHGRRRATIAAVAVFGGFTLAIPFARNLTELAILRFFASFGVGGGMPLAIAYACDFARARRRALFGTLLFTGYTIGSSGGGLLAAEIVPRLGWRAIFYTGGIGGLAIGALLIVAMPESIKFLALRRPGDRRLLRYARKLQPRKLFHPETEFSIARSAGQRLPLNELFSDGRGTMTALLWFALGLAFCTHFFMSQWLTTLLTPEIGFAAAARTQAVFQGGAALAFAVGYLIDRRGIPVAAIAMAAAAIPVAAIGWTSFWGPAGAMALAFGAGVFVLGGDVGLTALPCVIYPAAIRSTATGAAFGAGRIGAILGPMFAGLLIWWDAPLATIFSLGAVPVLLSAIACIGLDRAARRQGTAPGDGYSEFAPASSLCPPAMTGSAPVR